MSIQRDFENDLFTLLKKYNAEIDENYHTPYQQSAYEIRIYDDMKEEYTMVLEIDNYLIEKFEEYLQANRRKIDE